MKVYTCFVSIISYFGPNVRERNLAEIRFKALKMFVFFSQCLLVWRSCSCLFSFFFPIIITTVRCPDRRLAWFGFVGLFKDIYISQDLQIYEAGVSEHM